MTDQHEGQGDPGALLARRYRLGLGLVAALIVLSQLLVQPALVALGTDAPLINVAGRQRMLSQRLAKAALALSAAADQVEAQTRRDELNEVLILWSASHDRLRDAARDERRGPGDPLFDALEAIEPPYARMRAAAGGLIAGRDGAAVRPLVADVLAAEAEFLTGMERAVGLFEREARGHVDRLVATGWGVTALALVALAAVGRFVLRPASRTLARQVEALRAARDELEARIRARTEELDRVNRDLAREAEERSRAEARHRALVEQFSHVARTTTVGEMASGLAHELNQPLGAIANYAEGCLVALDAPEPPLAEIRDVLGKVLATTLRAGAIVQRIRRFVTRHATAPEWCDPNRLVLDVVDFFRDEAQRRGIALRHELAPDLPNIQCDPVQVQQVLVNLVRNAFDALASQPVEPQVLMKTSRAPSGGLEFAVGDNGEGIPADRLPRVFDAYFSTRDAGMGMGLAISRTIVEAHQGRIVVESRPGAGTTFRFTLPVSGADDAGSGTDGLRG